MFSELTLRIYIISRSQLGVINIEFLQVFFLPYFLQDEMETNTVISLKFLNNGLVCWHLGTLDSAVRCSDPCNYHPTLYIDACTWVGLITLLREAAGYEFKRSLYLHDEETVHRGKKWGEVATLPEESLQAITLFLLLYCQ